MTKVSNLKNWLAEEYRKYTRSLGPYETRERKTRENFEKNQIKKSRKIIERYTITSPRLNNFFLQSECSDSI